QTAPRVYRKTKRRLEYKMAAPRSRGRRARNITCCVRNAQRRFEERRVDYMGTSSAQQLRELADILERGDLDQASRAALVEVSDRLRSIAATDLATDRSSVKTILRSEWNKMNATESAKFFAEGGKVVDN